MNNKVENFVLNSVADYLKIKTLAPKYASQVLNIYRGLKKDILSQYKSSDIKLVLGKLIGDKIAEKMRFDNTEKSFDLKEYQNAAIGSADQDPDVADVSETKKTLSVDNFFDIKNIRDLQLMFNPESLYEHHYVVLESKYRDTSDDIGSSVTKFKWKYSPTAYLSNGTCNSVDVIKNIIGMRMYQPRIQYVASMNNNAKRVSVLIEEFQAQSFIAENGRHFHFLLRPQIDGGANIELSTEDYNDGIFYFSKPIIEFSSLTLTFGNPLDLITFTEPIDAFVIPIEFTCMKSDN